MPNRALLPLLVFVLALAGCGEPIHEYGYPKLSGPYFGQPTPDDGARLFAPGLISDGLSNRDVTMMPDGGEMYFGVSTGGHAYSSILVTKLVDGCWTRPEVADFAANPAWKTLEPAISPDGRQFYFVSDRPVGEGDAGNWDIWVMDRQGDGWSEPRNLGAPVNSPGPEFFPSVTRDGTMYFTRPDGRGANHIYRSRFEGGRYGEPERLPAQVNGGAARFNATIAPDESWLIVPTAGGHDTLGGVDYYITFRDANDRWSEPLNMGAPMNSADGREWSASISPDGRYLFFMTSRGADPAPDLKRLTAVHDRPGNGNPDIWWMSASFIEDLRAEARFVEEGGHE